MHWLPYAWVCSIFLASADSFVKLASNKISSSVGMLIYSATTLTVNAIHMHTGLKADLSPVREGDELRQSAFRRREQVDYGPAIGKVYIH